jgi:hypothetical protein
MLFENGTTSKETNKFGLGNKGVKKDAKEKSTTT